MQSLHWLHDNLSAGMCELRSGHAALQFGWCTCVWFACGIGCRWDCPLQPTAHTNVDKACTPYQYSPSSWGSPACYRCSLHLYCMHHNEVYCWQFVRPSPHDSTLQCMPTQCVVSVGVHGHVKNASELGNVAQLYSDAVGGHDPCKPGYGPDQGHEVLALQDKSQELGT